MGDRGRFSKEMKAALASRDGKDPEEASESDYGPQDRLADGRYAVERSNGLPSLVKESIVMRDARSYMATLTSGQKIACGFCSECRDIVMYCECDGGPIPPKYLAAEIDTWTPIP